MAKPITTTTGTGTVASINDLSAYNPHLAAIGRNLTYAIHVTPDDGSGTMSEQTHTQPEVGVGDKVSFTVTDGPMGKFMTEVKKID